MCGEIELKRQPMCVDSLTSAHCQWQSKILVIGNGDMDILVYDQDAVNVVARGWLVSFFLFSCFYVEPCRALEYLGIATMQGFVCVVKIGLQDRKAVPSTGFLERRQYFVCS